MKNINDVINVRITDCVINIPDFNLVCASYKNENVSDVININVVLDLLWYH